MVIGIEKRESWGCKEFRQVVGLLAIEDCPFEE
jgi:hypothetical protein